MPAPSRLKPVPPVDCGGLGTIDVADRTLSRASALLQIWRQPALFRLPALQRSRVRRTPRGTGFSRESVRWYATELVLTTNNCRSALARDRGGPVATDVSDRTLSRASALLQNTAPASIIRLSTLRHSRSGGTGFRREGHRTSPQLAGGAGHVPTLVVQFALRSTHALQRAIPTQSQEPGDIHHALCPPRY